MSSNANGSEESNGADGETNPRVNHPELESFYRARAILHGISDRALSRATHAIRRSRGMASTSTSSAAAAPSAAAAVAASEAASSLAASSHSLEQLLEQREIHLEQRRGRQEQRERMRQRAERAEARRERSRERRSRRRLRQADSSSENEESASRRILRAHNVVASLQDIMLVPTSSTLGESTEGGTPRSNSAAAAAARPSENQNAAETNSNNNNSANSNNNVEIRRIRRVRRSRSRGPSTEARSGSEGNNGDVSGVDTNNNSNNTNSNDNAARSRRERRRGREGNNGDDDDESDDDSTMNAMDDLINSGTGFELNSLIDRDRLLNNLMQRSITMLRDIEGVTGTQRSTDLKCPVCNEVFCDYEASDHPNFPGNRSGSIRCSHGALTLFTKLHQCPICFEEDIEPPNVVALSCGHVLCKEDFGKLGGHVGAERPEGCPKAKPVPPQSTTSERTSGTDNNNDSGSNNNNIFRFTFHS